MKSIFVDTNILVDLIGDRKPFSKFAIEIFNQAEAKNVRLFTSSHAFATTYYLLKKYIDEKQLKKILDSLLDYIQLIPVTQDTIRKALKSPDKDFEDSIQMLCAYTIPEMDFIVTRNIKDFKNATIPVYPPEEAVEQI